MTDLPITEIESLLENATEGPWSHVNGCMAPDFVIKGLDLDDHVQIVCGSVDCIESVANAKLIAAAPTLARQCIDLDKRLAEAEKERDELKAAKLSDLFLANFPYEVWGFGDDEVMRLNDWVELNYQDHNGTDHSDGIGRVCLHHDTGIPVILMVEGFEDDGEPHGTYSPISYHPWNTIYRISETDARANFPTQKEDT